MNILGIHLDFPFVRMSLIRKKGKALDVRNLKMISLEPPEGRHAEKATSPEKAVLLILEDFKGKIASGLNSNEFLIRSIETKNLSLKHIEETIRFQSEATSHFKPEDVITVPLVSKKDESALLFTVLKNGLKDHLTELKKFNIEPDTVSTVSSALCHFIHWKYPKLDDAFIIDLGSKEILCSLLEKGKLKKSHLIPGGITSFLGALLKDRKKILLKKEIEGAAKQIDLLLLKPGLNPNLSSRLKETKLKIDQIYYSYTRGLPIPVIFTGFSDSFLHLREYLMDFSENEYPLSLEEQHFAASIGLAIEQTTKQPLQLLRDEFFPEKNWAKMGFFALSLLLFSFALSSGLVFWGIHSNSLRTKQMFEASNLSHASSFEEMEEKLSEWITSIEKNNKEYPYILQAPTVARFLSWISSHPLLNELKKEDPIQIHEVRYFLERYPKANSGKEPFLAKVELEFSFQSAMNARRFHELLRKGDALVNPNLDITWEALQNSVRTSFYLKNERPHVF